MNNHVLGVLLIIFMIVQVFLLVYSRRHHTEKLLAYRHAIVTTTLYNGLLVMVNLELNRYMESLIQQLIPILAVLVFRYFYIEYFKSIELDVRDHLEFFAINLFPIILTFVLGIDFLRMMLNREMSQPSIGGFQTLIMVLVVSYQIFILIRLLMVNIRLYRDSLERYRQVFLGHILVDGIYTLLTLTILITNQVKSNIMVSGVLFTLFTAFLSVNHVRKEWLPHAKAQPLVYDAPLKVMTKHPRSHEDRRALDSLTGVFTKRYFMAYLEELEVNDDTLSLVLMDVSGLKLINENYGFHIGDEVLLDMSVAISEAFLKGSIARISGRTFAVLVSGEDEDSINDKIRAIKATAEQQGDFEVQLNFGYYIRGREDLTPLMLYARAKEDLYYNRIMVSAKHQDALAQMLFKNFKNFMPDLTSHLQTTSNLAVSFGRYLGLDQRDLEDLKHAALLHDIALTTMPVMVELEMVLDDDFSKKSYVNHVYRGYEIAVESGIREKVARVILEHHEKYDGSGFPNHLKGDQILNLAQILSLVDYVDVYKRLKGDPKDMENKLLSKVKLDFSEELVYNMIAFLKENHI